MEATLKAIYIALQTAPLIALAITLPHTVFSYARAKSLNVRRSTYIYIFVLYFLCAYFMTMLPLPSRESFAEMRPVSELIQLVPFQNFLDIRAESFMRDFAILFFNVILTVPLGFFLRFLFGFKFGKTVLMGFLTSLLYEVTQLTGLFFIYPRPYRIFDVDDLMINTLGALIGYFTVPLLARILPNPKESKRQLVQGSEVSFFQRCGATFIDFSFVFCIVALPIICIAPLGDFFIRGRSLLRFPAFFTLFLAVGAAYASITSGGTLGQRITGLRLLTKRGKRASRLQSAARFSLIFSSIIAIPFWVTFFMTVNTEYAGIESIIWVFFGALLMMCAAAILLEMMFNAVTHGSSMFYDRLVRTHVAYGSSRKTSLFGIRVIDIRTLEASNIDILSDKICETLLDMGVPRGSIVKVRLMAEGIMLDWMSSGLSSLPCELRLDKRFKRKTLMLSVADYGDEEKSKAPNEYVEMLGGLELTVTAYRAGEKNICNIRIP